MSGPLVFKDLDGSTAEQTHSFNELEHSTVEKSLVFKDLDGSSQEQSKTFLDLSSSTIEKPLIDTSVNAHSTISKASFGLMKYGTIKFGLKTTMTVVEKPQIIAVVDGVGY